MMGSPDESLAIVERLAEEYSNIKVISQENAGMSAARNTGMWNATGDYYMFVDSDDWIADNCLGRIVEKLRDEEIDALAICAVNVINGVPQRRQSYTDATPITGRDLLKRDVAHCAPFPIWKALFRMMERKVNVMIHANEPRLKYLESLGMIKHPEKQFFLRNYPDFNEIDRVYDETYRKFDEWLGDGKCVYLQAIGKDRADIESIESVLAFPELKGVVIGRLQEERLKLFEDRFGKEVLQSRIFFTGQIKQLKTPQYIRRCAFSLIFYKNTSANNWYCEPNRMFQNVINGNPVIVGNNPPMKDYVENGQYGVVVNTDGSNVDEIKKGIQQLLDNYETYKANVTAKECGMWSEQEGTIEEIVETFIAQ